MNVLLGQEASRAGGQQTIYCCLPERGPPCADVCPRGLQAQLFNSNPSWPLPPLSASDSPKLSFRICKVGIIMPIPTSVGRALRIFQTYQEDSTWLQDWPDLVSPPSTGSTGSPGPQTIQLKRSWDSPIPGDGETEAQRAERVWRAAEPALNRWPPAAWGLGPGGA